MKVIFSEVLLEFMKVNELNQQKLANALGVNQSTISFWLSNKKEPTIENLWKIADLFGTDIDILVGRKNY